jgi:hypothetical protein
MQKDSLVGKTFGRLKVVSYSHSDHAGKRLWKCSCDCGNETMVRTAELKSGKTKSCRYHARWITHGKSKTTTYKIWQGMRKRCENPKHRYFFRYGGRGIRVDERWGNFESFLSDMGERPDGHEIDRIDVNGNYSPENCRWATSKENQNNRRNSIRLIVNGTTYTPSEASLKFGVPAPLIYARLKKGMVGAECVATPRHRRPRLKKIS